MINPKRIMEQTIIDWGLEPGEIQISNGAIEQYNKWFKHYIEKTTSDIISDIVDHNENNNNKLKRITKKIVTKKLDSIYDTFMNLLFSEK